MDFEEPREKLSNLSDLIASLDSDSISPEDWRELAPEQVNLGTERYEITGFLGRGGMATVYKARHTELKREVAIKILPPGYKEHVEFGGRFKREAQILANLSHPNIVDVYDFGESDDGDWFYVMEYVEGKTLQEFIHVNWEMEQMTDCVTQLTTAIQYLHDNGIIHRDIKPSNILISTDGKLKVSDFGLAKNVSQAEQQTQMTLTGMVMGTYDYMAPEHRRGVTNKCTDVYSIGVVIYEMLMKELPDGRFAMPSEKSVNLSAFDTLINAVLAQQPEKRLQGAREVQQLWNNSLLSNSSKSAKFSPSDWWKKKTVKAGAVALSLAAGVAIYPLISDGISSEKSGKSGQVEKTPKQANVEKEPIVVEKKATNEAEEAADAPPLVSEKEEKVAESDTTAKEVTVEETEPQVALLDPSELGSEAGERREFELIPNYKVAFRWCPPGKFMMGSPPDEKGRTAEGEEMEYQHQVTLTKGFWMAETECTMSQWNTISENKESSREGMNHRRPVVFVSWNNIQNFCELINESGILPKGYRASLPTEAQWEYACRAGTTTPFYTGETLTKKLANWKGRDTVAVKSYLPNPWGLYDMHGNVQEWCLDVRSVDYIRTPEAQIDPTGPEPITGKESRVIRGGAFYYDSLLCRSAFRNANRPGYGNMMYGFRLAIVYDKLVE